MVKPSAVMVSSIPWLIDFFCSDRLLMLGGEDVYAAQRA